MPGILCLVRLKYHAAVTNSVPISQTISAASIPLPRDAVRVSSEIAALSSASPALQLTGMPTAVRSHAKINLGLHIGAPRSDGFHGLATVYQTLELYDVVTVTARRTPGTPTSIKLTSNDSRVPTGSTNTVWKIIEPALRALSISAEVAIHIDKRLPVQGGLGAGSANAVAALVGLEVELGMENEALKDHFYPQHPAGRPIHIGCPIHSVRSGEARRTEWVGKHEAARLGKHKARPRRPNRL